MARSPRWLLLALLAAATGCADDGAPSYVGTPGETTTLVIEQGVPWVTAKIDGAAGRMLVDTGLPRTLLHSTTFAGLEPGLRRLELEAFGLRFPDFAAVVVREQAVTPVCASDTPGGLLGHDLYGHFRLAFDYRGGQAVLDRSAAKAAPPLFANVEGLGEPRAAPLTVRGGGLLTMPELERALEVPATRLVAEVEIEGAKQRAIIDTGSSLTVLSRELYDRLGGHGRPELCCVTVGMLDGAKEAHLARLRELRMGEVTVESLPVLVLDQPLLFDNLGAEVGQQIDLLIGGSLLRLFAFEIDYTAQRMRMRRYLDPSHLEAEEYLLPGFSFCEAASDSGAMVVLDVFEGSDAESKGVARGQLLQAVDGQSVGGLTAREVRALIRARGAGATARLSFRAGESSLDVDVVVEQLLPEYR